MTQDGGQELARRATSPELKPASRVERTPAPGWETASALPLDAVAVSCWRDATARPPLTSPGGFNGLSIHFRTADRAAGRLRIWCKGSAPLRSGGKPWRLLRGESA